MFRLAIQAGKLVAASHLAKLEEAPPRQGFFEHPECLAVRTHLPADYQDVLDFGYHSGWRRGETLSLEWRGTSIGGAALSGCGRSSRRRRTVARNLVRANVPERVAMTVTGHETRSIFDRYNIVNESDQRQAAARLAEYIGIQSDAPAVVPIQKAITASGR